MAAFGRAPVVAAHENCQSVWAQRPDGVSAARALRRPQVPRAPRATPKRSSSFGTIAREIVAAQPQKLQSSASHGRVNVLERAQQASVEQPVPAPPKHPTVVKRVQIVDPMDEKEIMESTRFPLLSAAPPRVATPPCSAKVDSREVPQHRRKQDGLEWVPLLVQSQLDEILQPKNYGRVNNLAREAKNLGYSSTQDGVGQYHGRRKGFDSEAAGLAAEIPKGFQAGVPYYGHKGSKWMW
eukprot:TRINITY_DN111646_c0_g1_i1.p1 TRINITY_DN111646_c0_g1~~TRINITY_DN111646_c0_g1_i1.p1  ORF type:complete len:239 (+),score=48.54 TRINITY_DN111646_c0_g1_i1:74-790(+)